MSKRRVVVTGMGIVSPLGNDLASSWDGIVNGRSGIGPVTHFDASTFPTRIAGLVREDFDITRWVSPKDAMQAQIALGRFGSASDIAEAVAFLAGPSAAYITGETLHVNGGMYMP